MTKTVRILCLALVLLLALPLGIAHANTATEINDGEAAQYRAIEQARDAIIEKYGHTRVTLGMFYETVTLLNTGAGVTLHPVKLEDKLGTYTVTLADGRPPVVTWTLDGDKDAWGSAEIEAFTESDRQFYAAWRELNAKNGDFRAVSLEEWANMGDLLIPEASFARDSGIPQMPEADDLPYEDAVRLTKEAAAEQYGMPMETLDAYEVYATFTVRGGERYYAIYLAAQGSFAAGYEDVFSATVYSPSGIVEYLWWNASPGRLRLPEGPLGNYREMVTGFIQSGEVNYLPHAERAALQKRLDDEGLSDLADMMGLQYAVPQEGMISEEDALEAAKKVLADTFDITEELLPLYGVNISLCHLQERKISWAVEFYLSNDLWVLPEMTKHVSGCVLYLSAEDGSLEIVEHESPMSMPLMSTVWMRSMLEPYGLYSALVEDPAASRSNRDVAPIHQMLRDLGCSQADFPNMLPGEGELSEEAAVALVREKLIADYALTDEQLDGARWYTNFTAGESLPRWYISVMNTKPGLDDGFSIVLDGVTGDFYQFSYTLQGNG